MWSKKYSIGFTIIEVVLFLAVSGFLLTIAIFGMGSQMRSSRFRDSMQSAAAYVNKQYSDIQSGVNNRKQAIKCTESGTTLSLSDTGGALAGSSAGCMLIGREFILKETSIKANDIIASSDCSNATVTFRLLFDHPLKYKCYYVLEGSESQYNSAEDLSFSWGTRLEHGGEGRSPISRDTGDFSSQQASDYYPVTGFIILRNLETSHVDTYVIYKNSDRTTKVTSYVNAQLCFKGQANYPAGLYFGYYDTNTQSSQNLVNAKIDDSSCANWQY